MATDSDLTREPSSDHPLDALIEAGFGSTGDRTRPDLSWLVAAIRQSTDTDEARVVAAAPSLGAVAEAYERYDVRDQIGRGGMGAVFRGRDPHLGRDVAIKVLADEHADDPTLVHRFIEEAQIGGQLQHPGIVPVHEVGYRSDRRPYFTMKLVEGATLAERLQERPDPAEDRIRFLSIFEKIAQTMAYAHACGVVHRDLKPANIMIGRFGEVQIMDWGLAKVLSQSTGEVNVPHEPRRVSTVRSESDATRSQSGSVMGTSGYMPPEQASGDVDAIDERADVFSMGAILCEILTGHPAYRGTPKEARERARNADLGDAFERLAETDADDALLGIARGALAADPEGRPSDAAALAERFHAYRCRREARVRDAELSASRARMRLAIVVAVAIVLALCVLVLQWRQSNRLADERRLSQRVSVASRETRDALHFARHDRGAAAWLGARAAAERAWAVIVEPAVAGPSRRRVETLVGTVTREADAADHEARVRARDRKMGRDLEAIRIAPRPFDRRAGSKHYGNLFCDYGIDVVRIPSDVAADRIRASRVRPALTHALDAWMLHAISSDPALAKRIFSVAQGVDTDAHRTGLRRAILARDIAKLRSLVGSADVPTLSIETLVLCAAPLIAFGEIEAATTILRAGVERQPSHFWLHEQLERSLHLQGEHEAALDHAKIMRALRPESPTVWARFATRLREIGDKDAAEAAATRAVELGPNSGDAHSALGRVLRDRGDRVRAAAAFRKAASLCRNPAYDLWQLGNILSPSDPRAAERAYAGVVEYEPNHIQAWERLGQLRREREDFDGAADAFRNVVSRGVRMSRQSPGVDRSHRESGLDPGAVVARAHHAIGRMHEQRHAFDRAATAFAAAARTTTKPANRVGAWQDIARCRTRGGDFDAAIAAHETVIERATKLARDEALSDRMRARARLAILNALEQSAMQALHLGRFEEADRLARRVLARGHRRLAAATLGRSLEGRGRYREALKIYARLAASGFPAAVSQECRRKIRALEAVERHEKDDSWPEQGPSLEWLAVVCMETGRSIRAATLYARLLKPCPDRDGESAALHEQAAIAAAHAASVAARTDGERGAADERRARWRRLAIRWLRESAESYAAAGITPAVRSVLAQWRHHRALRILRDVASLPEDERASCIALWQRVDVLRRVR